MKFQPLPASFFEPSAQTVAPALLGHWLIRQTSFGFWGGPIVETEAYLAGDPASHGFARKTARNQTMYGPPGYAYVYFIYGNHFCVNAVCRPAGHAEAILVRAIEAQFDLDAMKQNRPGVGIEALTNGPGKLCAALKIDRALDGANLCDPASPIIVARNPGAKAFCEERGPLVITTRVGINRAAELPLRFYLKKSRFVSRKASLVERKR